MFCKTKVKAFYFSFFFSSSSMEVIKVKALERRKREHGKKIGTFSLFPFGRPVFTCNLFVRYFRVWLEIQDVRNIGMKKCIKYDHRQWKRMDHCCVSFRRWRSIESYFFIIFEFFFLLLLLLLLLLLHLYCTAQRQCVYRK